MAKIILEPTLSGTSKVFRVNSRKTVQLYGSGANIGSGSAQVQYMDAGGFWHPFNDAGSVDGVLMGQKTSITINKPGLYRVTLSSASAPTGLQVTNG